jgi:hypothetical protein
LAGELSDFKLLQPFDWLQLRVAALNSPRTGNMGGINSINYACYREVDVCLNHLFNPRGNMVNINSHNQKDILTRFKF